MPKYIKISKNAQFDTWDVVDGDNKIVFSSNSYTDAETICAAYIHIGYRPNVKVSPEVHNFTVKVTVSQELSTVVTNVSAKDAGKAIAELTNDDFREDDKSYSVAVFDEKGVDVTPAIQPSLPHFAL